MIKIAKFALGNKTKIVFLANKVFGQKFTRNAKNFCFQVFLSLNVCGFDPEMEAGSR